VKSLTKFTNNSSVKYSWATKQMGQKMAEDDFARRERLADQIAQIISYKRIIKLFSRSIKVNRINLDI